MISTKSRPMTKKKAKSKKEKYKIKFNLLKRDFIRLNLRYILYAYGVIILIYLLHLGYIEYFQITDNYHKSFSASLMEDLIFFGLVGTIVFIISQRDGSELPLKYRVANLANESKNIDDPAVEYLYENIKPLLGYNDKTNIDVVIEDVTDDNKLIKVFTSVESRIMNLCSRETFDLVNSSFSIYAPNKVGQDYGYISCAGVKNIVPAGFEKNNSECSPPNIAVADNGHNPPLKKAEWNHPIEKFTIPKGGKAESKMGWAVWEKLNEDPSNIENWYYIELNRFTDEIHFDIQRSLDRPDINLVADIRINFKNSTNKLSLDDHLLITKTAKKIPINVKLRPGDKIEFILRTVK